jgi:ribosomal protein S18 acetylase RimI-like enzyme
VLNLRRASAGDAPLRARVAEQAFAPYVERMSGQRPAPMDADYEALVADAEAWVAEVEGAVIGFLIVIGDGDRMLLEGVAVHPSHQGIGAGRALLSLAEDRARAGGYRRISLYTHETMVENQQLYERIGYVETHRGAVHGFTRIFYEKTLAG